MYICGMVAHSIRQTIFEAEDPKICKDICLDPSNTFNEFDYNSKTQKC